MAWGVIGAPAQGGAPSQTYCHRLNKQSYTRDIYRGGCGGVGSGGWDMYGVRGLIYLWGLSSSLILLCIPDPNLFTMIIRRAQGAQRVLKFKKGSH